MLDALVVDDEAPARDLLSDLLTDTGLVRVVGTAAAGGEALKRVSELRPDVVFLDIQMPGQTGLDVAQVLLSFATPPSIVFVTAFDTHAVQAFELEAVDYLLKPVDPARLRRCLQRLERPGDGVRRVLDRLSPDRLALLDEASGVRHVVALSDILWFTSEDEKTYAQTTGRVLRSMETLATLEEKLSTFVRTHRSYLVNIERVREVVPWANGAYNLRLHGSSQEIPLSRNHAADFKARTGW